MDFFNRHGRKLIALFVVLCAIAAVLTGGYRFRPNVVDDAMSYVTAPFMKLAAGVSGWFKDKTGGFADAAALKDENERLHARVDELVAENKRLKLAEEEGRKLSELLKLDEKYPELPKVGAGAVATDSSNWFSAVMIDKGTNDGLENNLAVLASGGLFGRIVKAGAASSEVITILDSSSAVSVKCSRTGDLGIVKGDLELMQSGLCRMDYVGLDAEIMEGDELITSQMGEVYPPGVTVGYVKEVKMDSRGLNKYAVITPAADFQNIETVLVVTRKYNRYRDYSEVE